jgi:hypothetical protein
MYGFLEETAAHAMTRTVSTVTRSLTVRELGDMIKRDDFNTYPVVEDGQVVGIVTKFDVLKCFAFTPNQMVPRYVDLMSRTVGDIMVSDFVYVRPDTRLTRILQLSASIGYEKEIRAAHDQAARDWRVDAHIVRDRDGFATLQVEARDKDGQPLSGLSFRGMLERPTDKRADLAVALSEVGNGVYRGNAGDRARTMGSGDRGRYGGGRADVPVQEPRDAGLME